MAFEISGMTDLLLCILANVGIFVAFRSFTYFQINTFHAIVANYFFCVVTGLLFIGDIEPVRHMDLTQPWVKIGFGLGAIFVGTFYLMAITTQKFSITIASIAAKISLVIPVLISLLVLGTMARSYAWYNYVGIGLALLAIMFTSIRRGSGSLPSHGKWTLALPILVFLAGGLIDTTINYTNYKYLKLEDAPIFPLVTFGGAFFFGFMAMIFTWRRPSWQSLLGGALLGSVNYFSLFFLVRTLTGFHHDGAFVYPIVNTGIILISAMISISVFQERLNGLKIFGLVLAVISILLISFQELFLR